MEQIRTTLGKLGKSLSSEKYVVNSNSSSLKKSPSNEDKDLQHSLEIVKEGTIEHIVHVRIDPEGNIKGLPSDFKQRLNSILITEKERTNVQNTETAKQVILWSMEQEKKNQHKDSLAIGKFESSELSYIDKC